MVLHAHGRDSQVLHHVRGTLPDLGVCCQQWDGAGDQTESKTRAWSNWRLLNLQNLSSQKRLRVCKGSPEKSSPLL